MENFGCNVIYLPVNCLGILEPKVLSNAITSDVNLVSIMLVNNEIGARQDIKKLAKLRMIEAPSFIQMQYKQWGISKLM